MGLMRCFAAFRAMIASFATASPTGGQEIERMASLGIDAIFVTDTSTI
jgi:hypothetical protein